MTEVTPASESHRRHDPEQIERKRQGRRLSTLSRRLSTARTGRYLAFLLLTVTASLLPMVARGQGTPVAQAAPSAAPMFWYLLAAAMAMLVPVGLVLIAVAAVA